MPAATLDITLEQGATFSKTITVYDDASPPVPINLTGYQVRAQIRKKPKSDDIIATFDTEIDEDPETGRITWSLAATVSDEINVDRTSTFDPLEYFYDLELEAPSGFVTRLLQGYAYIVPNVTREEA